jgi:predicted CoA-binding protein
MMSTEEETVAILGASNKQERYSFKAFQLLRKLGYNTIPVHPALEEIEGVKVVSALDQIDKGVDTLTIYVNSNVSVSLADEIIALNPLQHSKQKGFPSTRRAPLCCSKPASFRFAAAIRCFIGCHVMIVHQQWSIADLHSAVPSRSICTLSKALT